MLENEGNEKSHFFVSVSKNATEGIFRGSLIISGLVSLYLSDNINEVFWAGVALLSMLGCANLVLFLRIQKHIREVGKT
ncbi:MAG: hypothetical protein OXD47_10705 [Gammaproteobacteria bacterium]|nr:hypothetical protein [Gammaproteobacteria bacterium]MCY4211097.1 hypothetical protein [Gammaproteobacteria bacterium]MCY4339247.1 hypothetical protein [Gammaproteobacteria bacterium]